MGYTHYFPLKNDFSDEAWLNITRDVRRLIENLPEHSLNAGGFCADWPLAIAENEDSPDKPPVVDDTMILFNGVDPSGNGKDLGHETFGVWKRKEDMDEFSQRFNFCKTAGKPYDLVVCGALLVMHHHSPESLDIGTDGEPEDWRHAFEWVRETLGIESKLFGGIEYRDPKPESGHQDPLDAWFAACSSPTPSPDVKP